MIGKKKKSNKREPERLSHGKQYHRQVQEDWHRTAEGEVEYEEPIVKPSGRKGRIDIFVDAKDEDDKNLITVVEIKASDWDSMTLEAVRRNVRRQANQIWDYIESQIKEGKHISPGIVFPKKPKDLERLKLIEGFFEERCISVSWEDEPPKERKAKS